MDDWPPVSGRGRGVDDRRAVADGHGREERRPLRAVHKVDGRDDARRLWRRQLLLLDLLLLDLLLRDLLDSLKLLRLLDHLAVDGLLLLLLLTCAVCE